MVRHISCVVVILLFPWLGMAAIPGPVENVIVFRETDRFAGWPANNGVWSWGDEIVVGFTLGYHKEKNGGHPIDNERPTGPRQARSLDGGRTWLIEIPSYLDEKGNERDPMQSSGGIEFTHPDFAMAFRMTHSNRGYSRYYYSYDRCRTWKGPYLLPTFDRKGIFARTDYIVNGRHDLMAFLTAAKDNGNEGWPFCARTQDGGKTWEHVSWIGKQPAVGGYAIMPSTIRLPPNGLLSMIRRREEPPGGSLYWIEAFLSPDNGENWYLLEEPRIRNGGNPAHMIRLRDGRIVLAYGHRGRPYGIRAKISRDNGQTWGEEIILRDDGQSWDLGYPRTVERRDGLCVTIYYFNDSGQKERYITSTIWDPGFR